MAESANQMRTTPTPAWVGDAIAWGERDPKTDILTMYKPEGVWFAFNVVTGREVPCQPPTPVAPPMSEAEVVKQMHHVASATETRSRCYFVGAAEGPIKIGHSIDPVARLAAFQSGCPVKLSILAITDGGETREVAYHYQFREMRAHGEWFERCPEILAEIERLSA